MKSKRLVNCGHPLSNFRDSALDAPDWASERLTIELSSSGSASVWGHEDDEGRRGKHVIDCRHVPSSEGLASFG
jgi:hypothetical protein